MMFLLESIFLVVICLAISYFAISYIATAFNASILSFTESEISFMNFGNEQFVVLVGVMLIVALIANILPIKKLSKMKPIDVILNK